MKIIIIFISILSIFTSCSSSFDFNEAEKLIENLTEDSRIYRLTFDKDLIIINGQKVSQDKDEIVNLNEKGFNYVYKTDYLKSINVSEKEFDYFLHQFKRTKAYSVDYLNNKAYFIMDGFLDGSKGYLYSIKDLKKTKEHKRNTILLHDGNITVTNEVRKNWYKATAWH